MRIGMVADDLTGANDSGVQLSRYGLKTSVRFQTTNEDAMSDEAIVIDTDSRSIKKEDAYQRVLSAASYIKRNQFDIIYKKVDSTLRGNLGKELDAMYDEIKPELVILAPGYPKNGRKIVQGQMYLHDTPINETEIAKDPKCPVLDAYVPHVFQQQTDREIGLVHIDEIRSGYDAVKEKMDDYYKENTHYILFDSETEEDLKAVAEFVHQSSYNVVWLGSAGLANYLPEVYQLSGKEIDSKIIKNDLPVLLVAGSVSSVTRTQLTRFLEHPSVAGIELDSSMLIRAESSEKEVVLAKRKAIQAYEDGYHIAIFPTGDRHAIDQAQKIGQEIGLSNTDVSNLIVQRLGKLTNDLLSTLNFQGLILTGGDTAKQVCMSIGTTGIQLLDEIETGVPLGQLIGKYSLYSVTKAGAFGTKDTFIHAMKTLQGDEA
ncbi:four-carbon acid sugar kinase family protein [Aquibacillus salsiterrae]|uniref:Four-carbon acid sugar kinase family protein n=1 Tax=Aquibacillus salsiterrae TaxID=2950439 RepID=A0A9X3WEK6_9BACI|nr:four-carbon acid sugar kinase family protein [Aquibacillus salsiterrae]MDC3417568.1 four-carbon acid sugar kinase family protein [Aquibacillus salsiterrae]